MPARTRTRRSDRWPTRRPSARRDAVAGRRRGIRRALPDAREGDRRRPLGNAIIRLGWEANGDWYPWRASANVEAWEAYFRRIVGVMRGVQPTVAGVPAQAFEFDLTYNRGNSGTAVTFESMYPGDDVVDIIGLDAYDTKWMDDTSTPEARWADALTQPMGLAEFQGVRRVEGQADERPRVGLVGARSRRQRRRRRQPVLHRCRRRLHRAERRQHRVPRVLQPPLRVDRRPPARVLSQRFGLPVPPADTTAPTVALSSPRNGARVMRTVKVAATASDSLGAAGVQFLLDGAELGDEDRYAPFELSWDTRTATSGGHTDHGGRARRGGQPEDVGRSERVRAKSLKSAPATSRVGGHDLPRGAQAAAGGGVLVAAGSLPWTGRVHSWVERGICSFPARRRIVLSC